MLAEVTLPERLLHLPDATALNDIAIALHPGWHAEALGLLRELRWRDQLVACAAIVLYGGDVDLQAALWHAIDGGSWIAPQLVTTAFLLDRDFEPRAEDRLLSLTRRGPKVVASLVRAYHRLPKPRMNVVAQLSRYDAVLATEDARTAIRAVDDWLERLPLLCDATTQARWLRYPRLVAAR
jgi:hypothetical protein